jgi:2-dehydro-3-deoxy-D-gluconate 5-dehydrogenase
VLVNNAAAYNNVRIDEMPLDTFADVLDVNVNGAFWCARQASRRMLEQGDGGAIVNVTSIDALHPTSKGMSHYTTSKHALWGLTKCLALELGPHGIRANAVAPGPSLTEGAIEYIQAGAPEGIDIEAQWATAAGRVPMRRWAEPDEIARIVVFLASDLAAYVTGAQIVVDGGYLLGS